MSRARHLRERQLSRPASPRGAPVMMSNGKPKPRIPTYTCIVEAEINQAAVQHCGRRLWSLGLPDGQFVGCGEAGSAEPFRPLLHGSVFQKSSLTPPPNHPIIAPSRPTRGAYRDRRFARDGMRWTQRRRRARYACGRVALMRTAKSCGPDARNAGVKSLRGQRLPGRWWQEAPIHQGEHDIGRRAIAQGRPECFR
jgi:hypothetical protein